MDVHDTPRKLLKNIANLTDIAILAKNIMVSYYTVDRAFQLGTKTEVHVDRDFLQCKFFPIQDHFTREDLEQLVIELFPHGLNQHGKSYLLDQCLIVNENNGPAPFVPHSPIIELISELVRRLYFPVQPSRFSVLFAWSSLEEAIAFRGSHGGGAIYEVEAENAVKADMNLLYLGGSGIGALLYAMKYWRGEQSPNPRWEYLLVPPVRILRKIADILE